MRKFLNFQHVAIPTGVMFGMIVVLLFILTVLLPSDQPEPPPMGEPIRDILMDQAIRDIMAELAADLKQQGYVVDTLINEEGVTALQVPTVRVVSFWDCFGEPYPDVFYIPNGPPPNETEPIWALRPRHLYVDNDGRMWCPQSAPLRKEQSR